jgi:hypothetical protein
VAKTTWKSLKRAADAVEDLTNASATEKATKKATKKAKSKTPASRAFELSGEETEPLVPGEVTRGELDMSTITIAPPEDPEDYNICSEERTKLVTAIKSLLFVENPTPTFWACCLLGDIQCLKTLVTMAKESYGVMDTINITSLPLPLQCKSIEFNHY